MSPRPRPILCAVLDGAALGSDACAAATTLFEAGVDWIQLRDRALEAAPLLALARALVDARDAVRATSPDPQRRTGGLHAPRVVVNKRGDIALAVGADGVHLGMDALDARSARALWAMGRETEASASGKRAADRAAPRIGASIHALSELEAAITAGEPLDYVHLAPIWSPRSKPAERPPLGLETLGLVARIAAGAGLLVLAQGGLDAPRAAEAIAAGAAGVAVTGIVSQASDRAAAVRDLRRALDGQATAEADSDARRGAAPQ